jgi:hypothetical protein
MDSTNRIWSSSGIQAHRTLSWSSMSAQKTVFVVQQKKLCYNLVVP